MGVPFATATRMVMQYGDMTDRVDGIYKGQSDEGQNISSGEYFIIYGIFIVAKLLSLLILQLSEDKEELIARLQAEELMTKNNPDTVM